MKTLKIRLMQEKDVLALANLEDACFLSPWPEKEIRYELKENPVAKVYVALINDEIVGYIDFMITFDSASISRIGVYEEYRHQGIAQALLEKMIEVCKKQKDPVSFLTLEVRASNEKAINLYKKNQFSQVTIKKNYYTNGEDAIYMMRSVNL